MGSYVPSTPAQQAEMLRAVGCNTSDELYAVVPSDLKLQRPLAIPQGMAEMEVMQKLSDLSEKNTCFRHIFRGAGAYNHYIPAIVRSVVAKETFLTTYTPYQAEISQGVLQAIFEYQTMICELTGMDVANASVYDGANAAAEAVAMCVDRKRTKALVSAAAHPDIIETVRTYCWAANREMELIPACDGVTDLDVLADMLDDQTACVYLHQSSFYGRIEACEKAAELAHEKGAKFIMGVNPIASALLKTPAECNADIAVGEGQPLGMPLSFGGPYLGFMAATQALMRRLPGRIVGETKDQEGKRAFVLTLQAREQHIRREKASSNICTNQSLCALTAAAYLSTLGSDGLKEVAEQSMAKAHYLAEKLCEIPGVSMAFSGAFFHEFVTTVPVDPSVLLTHLEKNGVLGGLPVKEGILWCATEKNTKQEMDWLVEKVKEVCAP